VKKNREEKDQKKITWLQQNFFWSSSSTIVSEGEKEGRRDKIYKSIKKWAGMEGRSD